MTSSERSFLSKPDISSHRLHRPVLQDMSERFLILCRTPSPATARLSRTLESFGTVEVISDSPAPAAVWHADEALDGFHFLNGIDSSHSPLTARERAWKHLDLMPVDSRDNVWLIEDDVAGSVASWAELTDKTVELGAALSAVEIRSRENAPHWAHWGNGEGLFSRQSASFNPMCRLGSRLVSEVLEFRKQFGNFIFHEVLFASLAAEFGFSHLDWLKNELTAPLFKSYRFRPELTAAAGGICHPVKDDRIHQAICEGIPEIQPGQPSLETPYTEIPSIDRKFVKRASAPAIPGEEKETSGLRMDGTENGPHWNSRTDIIQEIIVRIGAESYLEIGYGDGENFAAIQCADKWSVDPGDFGFRLAEPTHRMASDWFFEENTRKFDVIFIDGLHLAEQVERDLEHALDALNPGGVVLCHDMNPTTEEMQRIPRVQMDWTGDGWKAWVALRVARPNLAMAVVDTDFGVGLILPGAKPGPTIKDPSTLDGTWTGLSRHRQEWLNLLCPQDAREFVLERLEPNEPLGTTAARASRTQAKIPERISGPPQGPTAIIFHGLIHRSLRHVIGNLREFLIKPLGMLGEVDIFFHSWDVGNITSPRSGEHGVPVEVSDVEKWLPEARGIFESQEAFDRTINWGPLFARNYTRHFTTGEEACRATLMNYRRAMESQERAWKYFQHHKEKSYSRVVVTRPDLLFLHPLPIPPDFGADAVQGPGGRAISPPLYVPRFEAWGGVCDRFAMGTERDVGIWSQKSAFVDGWLLNAGAAGNENSEWLLMKWLQRNRVKLEYIDFIHQRMRANGEVTWEDRYMVDLEPVVRFRAASEQHGSTPLPAPAEPEGQKKPQSQRFLFDYINSVSPRKTTRWFEDESGDWKQMFRCNRRVRAMEVGVADGTSGEHLLNMLFPHPRSELHVVNTDESPGAEYAFMTHMMQAGHAERIQLYNGTAAEILAWMISEEGFWESFDFIHHTGETAEDLLVASNQSWYLLRQGGLMVFRRADGRHHGACGLVIEAFVSAFGSRIQMLQDREAVILRKL